MLRAQQQDIAPPDLAALAREIETLEQRQKQGKLTEKGMLLAQIQAASASGSAAPDAMIVAPCSMGTLARIAASQGTSVSAITRASGIRNPNLIRTGQTLCIVEAMKLMNEIQAEKKCKVVDILVDDGESVEYGQPLVIIEPL